MSKIKSIHFSILKFGFAFICLLDVLYSQCNGNNFLISNSSNSSYNIHAKLNHALKQLDAYTHLSYTNCSSVPINELRFYMYLNSFKNPQSSFLKGTKEIFGQGYLNRSANEWGWIDISKITRRQGASNVDLTSQMNYVQPDDHNPDDQSVLSVKLDKPLLADETIELDLQWKAKMPKTIARMGYSHDFYFFCHWFPQLGVFEKDLNGNWGWNCHQAFRNTEYYADFSDYDLFLTFDQHFILAASGCLVNKEINVDGTASYHYRADKVIDVAWSISPDFLVVEDQWKKVTIRLLLPKDYSAQSDRYLFIIKYALDYLDKHVGPYPYASITVVCPPFHGLRSGLMEYPTLITTGSFYGMPSSVRLAESLVVHEFTHQYFMAVIASNEKEEPWMDEGFATYFEDRITDAAYGRKNSVINLAGFQFDNRELTRVEYTGMKNPTEGITARPGWDFDESNYKQLIYSKTATALHTLQNMLGEQKMDVIIQAYFQEWKFRHPRANDFMSLLQSELNKNADSLLAKKAYQFFHEAIFEAKKIDYSLTSINNEMVTSSVTGNGNPISYLSKINVHRDGDWIVPVDVRIDFEDGTNKIVNWSGVDTDKIFEFQTNAKIVSACIDPDHKLLVDLNFNNNSINLQANNGVLWRYSAKMTTWFQSILQFLSFIL